jgi:hypothetical protein
MSSDLSLLQSTVANVSPQITAITERMRQFNADLTLTEARFNDTSRLIDTTMTLASATLQLMQNSSAQAVVTFEHAQLELAQQVKLSVAILTQFNASVSDSATEFEHIVSQLRDQVQTWNVSRRVDVLDASFASLQAATAFDSPHTVNTSTGLNTTFTSGWRANANDLGRSPRFWMDRGMVHLEGIVFAHDSATIGDTIFVLPLGYRPPATRSFSTITWDDHFGQVQVNSDGAVTVHSADAWCYLDGVTFSITPL